MKTKYLYKFISVPLLSAVFLLGSFSWAADVKYTKELNAVVKSPKFIALKAKADEGNEDAQLKTAILLQQFAVAARSGAKHVFAVDANKYFEMAVEYTKNPDVKYRYAQFLLKFGSPWTPSALARRSAIKYLKAAAEMRHADAMATLAHLYMNPAIMDFEKHDFDEIKQLLENAARRGSVRAVTLLGVLFLTTPDEVLVKLSINGRSQAITLFEKAGSLGDPLAFKNLSNLYKQGRWSSYLESWTERDHALAERYFDKTVKAGNALWGKYTDQWLGFCGEYFSNKDTCRDANVHDSLSPATLNQPIEIEYLYTRFRIWS